METTKKVLCRSTELSKIKSLYIGIFLFESCANNLHYLQQDICVKNMLSYPEKIIPLLIFYLLRPFLCKIGTVDERRPKLQLHLGQVFKGRGMGKGRAVEA